jgi:hypothetical protein
MGLPIGVEQAVVALGGTELEKNGEYRLERADARIYVIPRVIGKRTSVDLAVRIQPVPGRGKLVAPPLCELADARSHESRLGGASGDLRTGNADFDDRVFVDLTHRDEEAAMLEILGSAEARSIVLDFIDSGAKVRIDPGPKAWLTARFERTDALESREQLERLALRLVELERLLPRFSSSGAPRGTPGCGCLVAAALLAFAGIVTANVTDTSLGSLGGGLEVRAVIASPLLYGLFLLGGWLLLRKRTRSRAPLIGLGVISLIAAPVTMVVLARVLNAVGDGSVHAERVTVLDKGVIDNRRGRDIYWLDVSGWGGHTDSVRLDIDPELHEHITKGDALVLRVGEGRLGFEWISDLVRTSPK